MTTVVNPSGSGSMAGVIVALLIATVVIALFMIYGVPALSGNQQSGAANIDVQVPTPNIDVTPTPQK